MVKINFYTSKDSDDTGYVRYILANIMQEYEGEITLKQVPEDKIDGVDVEKYGIDVFPTLIISNQSDPGQWVKLEGLIRKDRLRGKLTLPRLKPMVFLDKA